MLSRKQAAALWFSTMGLLSTAAIAAGSGMGGAASAGGSGGVHPAPGATHTSSTHAPAMPTATGTHAPTTQAGEQVTIDNFAFAPQTLTVPVGAKVTWTNRDDAPHTVTSTAHTFASKALDTDDQYSYVFTKAGTYTYFCAVHPHMKATVIVK